KELIPWDRSIDIYYKLLSTYAPVEKQQKSDVNIMSCYFSSDIVVLREIVKKILSSIRPDCFKVTNVFPKTNQFLNFKNNKSFDLDSAFRYRLDAMGKNIIDDCDQAILVIDHLSRIYDSHIFSKNSLPTFKSLETLVTKYGYKISHRRFIATEWYAFLQQFKKECGGSKDFRLDGEEVSKNNSPDLIGLFSFIHGVHTNQSEEEIKISNIFSIFPFLDLEQDNVLPIYTRSRPNTKSIETPSSLNKETTEITTSTPSYIRIKDIMQITTTNATATPIPTQKATKVQDKNIESIPITTPQLDKKRKAIEPTPRISTRKTNSLQHVRVNSLSLKTNNDAIEIDDEKTDIIISDKIKNIFTSIDKSVSNASDVKSLFNMLQKKIYDSQSLYSLLLKNKSRDSVILTNETLELAEAIDYDEIHLELLTDEVYNMASVFLISKNKNIIVPTIVDTDKLGFLWIPIVDGKVSTSLYIVPNETILDTSKVKAITKFIQMIISLADIVSFLKNQRIELPLFKSVCSDLSMELDTIILRIEDLENQIEQQIHKYHSFRSRMANTESLNEQSVALITSEKEKINQIRSFVDSHHYINFSRSQDPCLSLVDTRLSTLVLEYNPSTIQHIAGFFDLCSLMVSKTDISGFNLQIASIMSSFLPTNIKNLSFERETALKEKLAMTFSNSTVLNETFRIQNVKSVKRYLTISVTNKTFNACRIFAFSDVKKGFSISNLRNIFKENTKSYSRYIEYFNGTHEIFAFFAAPCIFKITNIQYSAPEIVSDRLLSRKIKSFTFRNLSPILVDIKVGQEIITSVKPDTTQNVQIESNEFEFTVSCMKFSFGTTIISKNRLNLLTDKETEINNRKNILLDKINKCEELKKKFIKELDK
ncbi:hypothetical protein DICPUDRAFT_4908, partial [Dictyostelium purpureum]